MPTIVPGNNEASDPPNPRPTKPPRRSEDELIRALLNAAEHWGTPHSLLSSDTVWGRQQ